MRKAVIDGDLTVQNVIDVNGGEPSGAFPVDWRLEDCTSYAVEAGDRYNPEDGLFYRDGEKVEHIPTPEERIERLEAVLAALVGGED